MGREEGCVRGRPEVKGGGVNMASLEQQSGALEQELADAEAEPVGRVDVPFF